jgi:capsular exopolysaccharide synthesis family protein
LEVDALELNDYLRILRRNWMLIVAFTLLGAAIASGVTLWLKPTYTAQTQLFVATQNSGTVTELQQGNIFGQARVQSYVKTVATPRVLQPVIDTLGLTDSPAQLAQRVTATAEANTVLINISVNDASPARAAAVAQAIGTSLVTVVDGLEAPSNGGKSPVKLSIVTPASAPASPSSPNVRMNLLLGILAGLSLGLAVAIFKTILDTSIKSESDVRRITDSPILGGIAFDANAVANPLISQLDSHSLRGESFRQLRTNLQFAHVSHRSTTILITSSLPGEGKSTTAANLAIAMAQSGQNVVLVDADLRRPMIGEYLGLERRVGLTTALLGTVDVDDVLQPWGSDGLYVLTSGQIPPNPSELLGSAALVQLIRRLENDFDAVIIDAPPLLPVTDAAILAQHVGGVAIVVGTKIVRAGELERALQTLNLVSADVLGLVLNRIPAKGPDSYAYHYYTPTKNQHPKKKKRQSNGTKRRRIALPDNVRHAARKSNNDQGRVADSYDSAMEPPHEDSLLVDQRRYAIERDRSNRNEAF